MNCPNCGKELKDKQKFCTNCGCKLASSNVFLTRLFSTTSFVIISVLSLSVALGISVFVLINKYFIIHGWPALIVRIAAIISLLILIINYKTRNLNIINANMFISCVLTVWLYLFHMTTFFSILSWKTSVPFMGTDFIIFLLMLSFGIYFTHLCLSDKNLKTRKVEWNVTKKALITYLLCCCSYILCEILCFLRHDHYLTFSTSYWIILYILPLALLMLFVFIYRKKNI